VRGREFTEQLSYNQFLYSVYMYWLTELFTMEVIGEEVVTVYFRAQSRKQFTKAEKTRKIRFLLLSECEVRIGRLIGMNMYFLSLVLKFSWPLFDIYLVQWVYNSLSPLFATEVNFIMRKLWNFTCNSILDAWICSYFFCTVHKISHKSSW
jgi:hypothetical protein